MSLTPVVPVAKFDAGVVDNGDKFATGVVDTGSKFATGVVDTGGAPWRWFMKKPEANNLVTLSLKGSLPGGLEEGGHHQQEKQQGGHPPVHQKGNSITQRNAKFLSAE
jgi:hypothetical protein